MAQNIEFQNRFNELIDETQMPKIQLAKDMNVDYRSFSHASNYGIVPKPMVLMRIADYFDVSLTFLLGDTDVNEYKKPSIKSNFYVRFEQLREKKNVSSYKVAKDCHFDKSYIYKWFTLKQIPSLELLEILADYFNVSIDYLLGRTDER